MLFSVVNGCKAGNNAGQEASWTQVAGRSQEITNRTKIKAMKAYAPLKRRVAFMAFSFSACPDAAESAVHAVNPI
jgi:hypothetical protein